MVQYGDSTVYFSRIVDRHLTYPGKLRSCCQGPWCEAQKAEFESYGTEYDPKQLVQQAGEVIEGKKVGPRRNCARCPSSHFKPSFLDLIGRFRYIGSRAAR
jgi:hypothetical protein